MDYSQLPLRDMQVPESIGWWPLAPGWWLLLVLSVVCLLLAGVYLRNRLRDPRRFALAELERIKQAYQQHQDPMDLLMQCNALLKRMAMTLYPRDKVASLSGQAWLEFLQQSGGLTEQSSLRILLTGPYQPHAEIDDQELINLCRKWLKQAGAGADV